ncbi:carboxylate-amine ligase [Streptomyces venezuelae]|uniref:carboxylate-amine ligase n=1 Tax=Streptomyces venezuelae TaxID=54571 RepID=UPI00278BDC1E|nr:glutamate--cysteine ligase [Streptomyces venezuelae]
MEILTMGVEEEFVLVDRTSRAPVDRAPEVIASATRGLGEQVQTEFFNAQVETVSRPTASTGGLRDELVRMRGVIASAAEAEQCLPVAVGTPVVPPERPLTVTDTERYRRMADRFASAFSTVDGVVCGCHVHVGTLDRESALALSSRMAPWLPVLQAVTTNSPFARRRDTGFDSWRSVEHARWPTVGPAPDLDEPRYLAHVAELVRTGTLLDRRMVYWHARPSEHVPTLEIRVADANADVDTVVMVAALVRGLAATFLTEVRENRPVPRVPLRRLLLAHELAARQGLAGFGVDPCTGRERPAVELVDRLVARSRPGLDLTGDTEHVLRQWRRIRAAGAGAARQRATFRRHGRFTDVVDALAQRTLAP